MTWPARRPAPAAAPPAPLLDAAGFAGLAVIALMIWRTGQYSPFLYRGGLVVLSLASAAVIAAAAVPRRAHRAGAGLADRCAGSGSAPTASTCGTIRSSC